MKIILTRTNDKLAFKATNSEGICTEIDANPTIGGEGLGMRPMELLISSMASCASIDVLLILKKKRISLSYFVVEIIGKRKNEIPSPFEEISLNFKIGENDPKEIVEKAVQLSIEKYCSVSASLNQEIKISWKVEFNN
jgi:putative redox protein